MQTRTYLVLPKAQRHEAFRAAGRLDNGDNALAFDTEHKLWYAREGASLDALRPWLPEHVVLSTGMHDRELSPQEEFAGVLTAAGFVLPDNGLPVMDGKRHRVAVTEDKPGSQSGVYVGHNDGRPAGWYQNHHQTEGVVKWKASGNRPDPQTAFVLRAQSAQSRWDQAQARALEYAQQADYVSRAWANMPAATSEHPYLQRKGVPATVGVRQDAHGNLVIPLRNLQGDIRSLQYISDDGGKNLKKGAEKSGNFFVVGGELAPPFLYAEGYATAASLHLATGRPVIMTVDAGNLPHVAGQLRAAFPDAQHLICGEDDFTKKDNKGALKAAEAALAVDGHCLLPVFNDAERRQALNKEAPRSDFNDLHQSRGLTAVREQVLPVLAALMAAPPMTPSPVMPSAAAQASHTDTDTHPTPSTSSPLTPEDITMATSPAPTPANPQPAPPLLDTVPLEAYADMPETASGTDLEMEMDPAKTLSAETDAKTPHSQNDLATDPAAHLGSGDSKRLQNGDNDLPQDVLPATPGSDGHSDADLTANLMAAGGEQPEREIGASAQISNDGSDSPADTVPEPASAAEATAAHDTPAPLNFSDLQPPSPTPESADEDEPEPGDAQPDNAPLHQAGSDADETAAAAPTEPESDGIRPKGPRQESSSEAPAPGTDTDALWRGLTHTTDGHQVMYALHGEPAFIDRGDQLVMASPAASQDGQKILAALLVAGRHYGGEIELTGSDAFKARAIALMAEHNPGLTLKNPAQRLQLDEAVRARAAAQPAPANAVDAVNVHPGQSPGQNGPVPEGGQPRPAQDLAQPAGQPADGRAEPQRATPTDVPPEAGRRPNLKEGLTGTLLAHGSDHYQFDPTETLSYYVTLRTEQGEKEFWGKELESAMVDSGQAVGDVIVLRYLGKQPVTVNVPVKDEAGAVLRWERQEKHRNQWNITPAIDPALLVDGRPTPPGAMLACDAQAFAALQAGVIAQSGLDLPPPTSHAPMLWLTPDGKGSTSHGNAETVTLPSVSEHAGTPVMKSLNPDGSLRLLLVRHHGEYLQGIVQHQGQYQHVLARLCPREAGGVYLTLNAVEPDGLRYLGHGNAVNKVPGQAVCFDDLVFTLKGEKAPLVARLIAPETIPAGLHKQLGFSRRYTPPVQTAPEPEPRGAPTAQPRPRPAPGPMPGPM